VGEAGQPRGAGGGVAGQLRVGAQGLHPRGGGAQGGAVGDQLVGPSALHQQLRLAVRAVAATTAAHEDEVRPVHQHVAGVGVGGARLGVQVVAVVPDRDQPRSATGAKTAARVPSTTFAVPRTASRKRR
jgi:hypothetical protein